MSWVKRLFGMEESTEEEGIAPATVSSEARVVGDPPLAAGKSNITIVLAEPKSFEEGMKIADDLKLKKPVVVNLEVLDHESARRCIDFLSGTIYALNGSVEKIAESVFLFAPASVGVEENRKRSWDQKGIGFDSILADL
jgi:FtsZ-interacting cell division protein YlmF